MVTATELLDLDGVGQRASDVRWDVLDSSLTKIGTVRPDDDQPATIEQNTNRRINRALRGLRLAPVEQAQLDPFGDRLRPVWILQDGTEYPLGVFILGSADRTRQEWGLEAEMPGLDQTLIIDVPTEQTVGYPAGQDVGTALAEQFTTAGVPSFVIDDTINTQLANPVSWPAGTTKRLDIINDLAALAGAYAAYFDNGGVGRITRVASLAATIPTLVYDAGGRILAGSMVESDDLLDAPNRYIVIDNGNPDAPVVGYFDVPAEAPNSIINRGYVVATVINAQGLATVGEATARAEAAYVQDHSTYQWVQFASPPDPRHDTHDAISYLGDTYREQGWQLILAEGTAMRHDLRRVYQ